MEKLEKILEKHGNEKKCATQHQGMWAGTHRHGIRVRQVRVVGSELVLDWVGGLHPPTTENETCHNLGFRV